MSIPIELPRHGSERRYRTGCRCGDCTSGYVAFLYRTRRGALR